MNSIDLDGTVVAVTGASVGLGRAMSLALASAGARVVLAAPETDLLATVAAEIEACAGPGRALAVRTDITVRSDCERMVAESIRHFGGLHALVNNARRPVRGPGIPPAGNFLPFWESNPDIWQESVHVNVSGTFQMSHVVAPHLIRNGWGRIVNISTSLGGLSQRHNSPYGVTKAAIEVGHADLGGRSGRHWRHRQFPAAGRAMRYRPQQATDPRREAVARRHHEPGDRLAGIAKIRRQDRRAIYRPTMEKQLAAGCCRRRSAGAAGAANVRRLRWSDTGDRTGKYGR